MSKELAKAKTPKVDKDVEKIVEKVQKLEKITGYIQRKLEAYFGEDFNGDGKIGGARIGLLAGIAALGIAASSFGVTPLVPTNSKFALTGEAGTNALFDVDYAGNMRVDNDATVYGDMTVVGAFVADSTSVNVTNYVAPEFQIGTLTVGTNATIGGTLDVTGVSTFSSAPDVNADIAIEGDATIGTNATVGGTLDVTGDVSTAALDVNGDADVEGDLAVGTNMTVGGTAAITGVATFSAAPDINADLDVEGDLAVGTNVTIGGTAAITGVATLTATPVLLDGLTVGTNATIGGTLGVTGATTTKAIDANGDVDVEGDLAVGTNMTVGGTADIIGIATFSASPDINADLDIEGDLAVGTNVTVGGTAAITGVATLTATPVLLDGLTVGTNATVGGTLEVTGVLTADGGLTVTAGSTTTLVATNLTITGAYSGPIAATSVCTVVNGIITSQGD